MAEVSQAQTKSKPGGSLNNQGDLDSRLLNGEADQQKKAGELRRSREKENNQEDAEQAPDSLRKQALKAKAQRKKDKIKAKVQKLNPVYQGTKKALKSSVMSLIPSFGLTLIYINIHVFIRLFLPMFFCKLGDEWMPDEMQAKMKATEKGRATARRANIFEFWAFIIVDGLVILVILGIALLISMLLDIVSHPISFLSSLVSDWFD